MELGLDIRINRRELFSKELYSNYQDEDQTRQIKMNFIHKILIWISASFSACLVILFAEFCVKRVKLF